MFWGLLGLLGYCALFWQGYRSFPKHFDKDGLLIGLLGVCIAMLLRSMFMHQLNDKGFSVALGLLAAVNVWIWPKKVMRKPASIRGLSRAASQKSRGVGEALPHYR